MAISYGTVNTFTVTAINSLGDTEIASTDWYDNTSNLAHDAAIFGEFTFGAAAPAAGETINIYIASGYDDGAEILWDGDYDSGLQTDGNASATVVDATDFSKDNSVLAKVLTMTAVASKVYAFNIPSVVAVLGGMPQYLKVLVENGAQTAADDFAASGNEIHLIPITYS